MNSGWLDALIGRLNPTNPRLWAHIGRQVTISRRAEIENGRGISLADKVRIDPHATVSADRGTVSLGARTHVLSYAMVMSVGGSVTIGEHCTIHPFSMLYGIGRLTIGNAVRIATHVVITPGNHVFDDPDTLIRLQGVKPADVLIGDDVWLGAASTVLGGVSIGRGAVVGAGAVVTSDVPEFAVVAGVPARVIKWRGRNEAR